MKADDLPRPEWCFDDVPEEQRWVCLYYEYARESRAAIQDRLIWRKHFASNKSWPGFRDLLTSVCDAPHERESLERFGFSPVRIIAACESFPKVPWSCIPISSRARAMEIVNWRGIEDGISLAKKKKTSLPLAKLTTVSFPISTWAWTDDELTERFKSWLLNNREPQNVSDRKPRGRKGSPDDLLNHLRILRLSRHAKCCRRSARRITEIKMDARNVSRAVAKAEAFLASFYK